MIHNYVRVLSILEMYQLKDYIIGMVTQGVKHL